MSAIPNLTPAFHKQQLQINAKYTPATSKHDLKPAKEGVLNEDLENDLKKKAKILKTKKIGADSCERLDTQEMNYRVGQEA